MDKDLRALVEAMGDPRVALMVVLLLRSMRSSSTAA